MPNSDDTHYLRDGEVILHKRENSNRWQVRFKLPSGDWQRSSTKKANLRDAKEAACELYDNARFLNKNGMPPISKRFRDVARLTIKDMENAIAAGKSRTTYRDYIQAIEKYLIPFFGSHHVDKISTNHMQQFDTWRIEKLGHTPAKSTINNHSGALNRVFKTAIYKNWMVETQIPAIPNNGKKANRRPAFTEEEWSKIPTLLAAWANAARLERSRLVREVLLYYTIILVFTGIRPGTEADNLKWNQIKWHTDPKTGKRCLALHLNGKVGSRIAIGGARCVLALHRIKNRFPDLADCRLNKILTKGVDEYVFRMRNGKRSKNLYKVWNEFLVEHNLLRDIHGEKRTLYSLRHTYATVRLLHNRVTVHELAIQMGTSVAMIEQHYSHVTPLLQAGIFAGDTLPEKYQQLI